MELNEVFQKYFIVFNTISYYKAVLVFEQAHPEFSVSAQNFHFGASLPFTVTTSRALFATTCSFKGSIDRSRTLSLSYTRTHTHTHTRVQRDI